MIINVPEEFYDEFLHFLDKGVKGMEDERTHLFYPPRPYTPNGEKCLEFIKNREWEDKPYNDNHHDSLINRSQNDKYWG